VSDPSRVFKPTVPTRQIIRRKNARSPNIDFCRVLADDISRNGQHVPIQLWQLSDEEIAQLAAHPEELVTWATAEFLANTRPLFGVIDGGHRTVAVEILRGEAATVSAEIFASRPGDEQLLRMTGSVNNLRNKWDPLTRVLEVLRYQQVTGCSFKQACAEKKEAPSDFSRCKWIADAPREIQMLALAGKLNMDAVKTLGMLPESERLAAAQKLAKEEITTAQLKDQIAAAKAAKDDGYLTIDLPGGRKLRIKKSEAPELLKKLREIEDE
jgi:hypothetical protein